MILFFFVFVDIGYATLGVALRQSGQTVTTKSLFPLHPGLLQTSLPHVSQSDLKLAVLVGVF